MIIQFLIAVLIVRYLKKNFHTAEKLPQWDKVFTIVFFVSLAFLGISVLVGTSRVSLTWFGHATLLFLLYILYSQQEFRAARSYMLAIAPFALGSIVVDLIKLLWRDLYEEWHNYFDAAVLFSIVWMIAMLVINNRQQKALQKEKLKTKEEEEQNKIMAGMKAELEVQVAQRTAELTKQKEELQHALDELRATQAQLIHAEKMASLGELTAGIAHEIQNPLNFVNNFSDVNRELISELVEEVDKGNTDEAKSIAADILQNSDKINHHGKRADAIVKGMLQHSRTSTGQREPTDINELADEYLRLAFHGLRAKDKSFNAKFETDFDAGVGKINVIPQDIGRVFLNLISNAFYSVTERKKTSEEGYEPTVRVTTKKIGHQVLIRIKDNGTGIPRDVMDKIFQPFFTTKPTGKGTGLGLSLSYDIVKAHGGELKVQDAGTQTSGSEKQHGAEFVVILPA